MPVGGNRPKAPSGRSEPAGYRILLRNNQLVIGPLCSEVQPLVPILPRCGSYSRSRPVTVNKGLLAFLPLIAPDFPNGDCSIRLKLVVGKAPIPAARFITQTAGTFLFTPLDIHDPATT